MSLRDLKSKLIAARTRQIVGVLFALYLLRRR